MEIRLSKGLWRKQWKFPLPSLDIAPLLLLLSPRNICQGPQQPGRVQAESSLTHTVMWDYPSLLPNAAAGAQETQWMAFQEAAARRLRSNAG